MSKDSRIPRPDVVGSRIPVPGSFRVPALAASSRLPAKRPGPLQPPATPIGFLRPPSQARSGAISIARSYSGDKLSARGEPSPFPTLTASTPAPAQLRLGAVGGGPPPRVVGGTPFLKKLDLAGSGTTERLDDIKLCRRAFAIPSDDDDEDDAVDTMDDGAGGPDATVQMLVDESLELVGAHSTDNLLDPPLQPAEVPATTESNSTVVIAGGSGSTFVRNEPTVTLQRDGNVTYEFRRSGTFVKSSRESLSSPSDDPLVQRPRPPVMDQTHARSVTAGSVNGPLALGLTRTFRRESTESLDSPVLFDLTRTMSFRRPSTGEMLLEEEEENGQHRVRRPPVLNSTMVNERLLNVTQSIPNITQELLYADGEHGPGDSVLLRTHLGEDRQAAKHKANRLTFNLEESLNLMQFGEVERTGASKPNRTQVLSSTLHSESMVIPAVTDGGTPLARSHPNSTMLLLDVSCAQDRTLVPSDERGADSEEDEVDGYAAERRRLNAAALGQRETSVEADVSAGKEIFDLSLDEPEPVSHREEEEEDRDEEAVVMRRKSESRPTAIPSKQRFSFGLDLTECTLDCSIELCDSSLSLTKPAHMKSPTASLGHVGSLTKQGSFEMDESLGILTPDQMKEFLDSTTTNTNNTNNANATSAGLELQLNTSHGGGSIGGHHHKHGALQHHCRIDQTPSPEELPLDPVGVKTDMSDIMLPSELLLMSGAGPQGFGSTSGASGSGGNVGATVSEVSQADSDPKTDQMSKSATSSKVSNSFITSITSITSLDTGYQGDGEMSRPASRGADHSPSNGPRLKSANGGGGAWQPLMAAAVAAVPRRQDPMTDSDFFTESDADDVFNRGDARRAQIIDGQLYGGANGGQLGAAGGQGANALFHAINEHEAAGHEDGGQNEDSCMESSGIFTDVENRADDDLVQRRADDQQEAAAAAAAAIFEEEQRTDDMSPDTSTDTISSSNSQNFARPCPAQSENESANETIRLNPSCSGGASFSGQNNAGVSGVGHEGSKRCASVDLTDDDDNAQARSGTIASGGSPPAGEPSSAGCQRDHHYQAGAATSTPIAAGGSGDAVGDIGVAGSPAAAAAAVDGAGSGSGSVVVALATAGSDVARRDVDACCSGASSAQTPGSGGSGKKSTCIGTGSSTSRKQLKNEANRGLRKHQQHAALGKLSSVSRVERLTKTRLLKDSPESPVPRGSGVDGQHGGSFAYGVGASAVPGGDCDQENKRPCTGVVMGTRSASGGVVCLSGGPRGSTVTPVATSTGGSSNLSFAKKSNTPNKWDAVMNKIAENKAVMKRNFSDVKSRISCGGAKVASSVSVSRRDSPATSSLKSPPSESASVASRTSAPGKRTISGSVKRGRTHSKDSSLSDLSLSGGSPKLTLKVSSTRPAKKRDVRTINSSSSDLGPPSKTNGAQPARSSAARAAAALQKRISPNLTSVPSTPLVPEQLKASPPTKRNLLLKRNGTATGALPVKTPLKDHNRLAGVTQNSKSSVVGAPPSATNASPKPSSKSLLRSSAVSSPTSATANHHHPYSHQQQQHQHAGSNGVVPSTTTTSATTVKAIQRNGTIILDKTTGSPLLICDASGAGGRAPEEPAPKQAESNCDQHHLPRDHAKGRAGGGEKAMAAPGPELVDISLLNHAQKGVEALGVLVQYLVFNLDAFSCPTIKMAHQKTTSDLLETKSMLDEERTNSQTLKQQLLETTERETELQQLHRCELSRVETCLSEQQRNADDRIATLEAQLSEKEYASRDLQSRIDCYEAKLAEQAKQLEHSRARELDLLQRINALSCTENELRDKVHSSELAYSERLQAAAMRERDLTEQIGGLNRDLDRMRRETEQKERELEEKLTITKDECVVLRQNRSSLLEPPAPSAQQNGGERCAANTSGNPLQLNRSSGNINHLQLLQDEVDSLRCVLDLKQREISELRKQTQEYERDAKELPGALVKISALESRIEDLQVQLKTKTEEEKELQQRLKQLQDNLSQESKIKSRLSLHNEELQWRLKQNSEKFTIAYAELSKSYHENSSYMMTASKSSIEPHTPVHSHHHHSHQLSHNQSRSSCSERFFDMDDISPPTSPVIKGMVEKSDSVSWVLEIDDEPPEVSASRMVRRAGSFRSNATFDNATPKRPKCGLNQTINGMTTGGGGGGIQQSTSAASILKQHSSDMSPIKPPQQGSGNHRLRSKSVSIKAAEPPKKIVRSNSGASASPCPVSAVGGPSGMTKPMRIGEMAGSWKEQPLYSSSPYAHKRFLSEDIELLTAGSSSAKPISFDQQQQHQPHRAKDLFLEETEFLSEPESPFARRPKLNGGEDIANPPVEVFHRDKTPNFKKSKENRGLITCDTTALTGGSSSTKVVGANGSGGSGVGVGGLTARDKRREFTRKANANLAGSLLMEAAGEALVSGSNSDDEASSSSSASSSASSCISEGSLSSASRASSSTASHGNSPLHGGGKRSSDRMNEDDTIEDAAGGGDSSQGQQPNNHHHHHHHQHRRRHSNISLEDALMKKIVASLNGDSVGTPMEVSWSEDGDPGSESIV
ncbi:uncharacterized protein LOC131266321 [Anopheles coustani]|uniref:uncharacterized protein LOC131266321 n=1 Tax=Anopheles coustani TaxID=139045 RepID=UPI00265893A3|nr:uncharacterized protein LOC131266321 [Anopheles coustani]